MYLVDTSVWLAQAFSTHPHRQTARAALAQASASQPAVICRATEQSFLRLASTPAVLTRYGMTGLTNEDALAMLEQLLAHPSVAFRTEPAGLVSIWHRLARRRTASPKVWMDAYLAAFAIAADLTILTLDADYQQFQSAGLKLKLL